VRYRPPSNRWDEEFEINYEQNLKDIERDISGTESGVSKAQTNATQALNDSSAAVQKANNVQAQVNALVVGSNTSPAETVQARVDTKGNAFSTIKQRIDNDYNEVTGQIKDIAYNIKTTYNAKGDYNGSTGSDDTQAIKNAIASSRKIYFPDGKYLLKDALIDFPQGTVLEGQSRLGTEIVVDVADLYQYLFKMNSKIQIRNLTISFKNVFSGSCILLNPAEVSFKNNNPYQRVDYYDLKTITIKFKWKSGKGTGLDIRIVNYDSNNVAYSSDVATYLVYFNPEDIQVLDGYKGVNIYANQKGTVAKPIWFTSSVFSKFNLNSCVYPIYILLENESTTTPLDFGGIRFTNTEIQCVGPGYYDDPALRTMQPIYIKGLSARKIDCKFSNLTIWDSSTGDSGYIENANVSITNFLYGYTLKVSGPNYKLGFNYINSGLNIDVDSRMRYTSKTTGNVSEVVPIDGGFSFLNAPDINGYGAKTNLYNEPNSGSNPYSVTRLETIDKNGNKIADLKMGIDSTTLFKGSNTKFDVYANGNPVINYGGINLKSDANNVDRGFFLGMGMYLAFEQTVLNVPNATGYQDVLLPIKELYTNTPFLISLNLIYADPFGDMAYDVNIRRASVLDKTTIKISLKHNKTSAINIGFAAVVCGFKDKNVITT